MYLNLIFITSVTNVLFKDIFLNPDSVTKTQTSFRKNILFGRVMGWLAELRAAK